MSETMLLSVENLTKFYSSRNSKNVVRALDHVSFELPRNCTLGIVGESGCGKTTLGKCILNIVEPTEGNIFFFGEDISHLSQSEFRSYRKNIQVVFQNPHDALNPRMKISRLLAEPFTLWSDHKLTKQEIEEKSVKLLAAVGIGPEILDQYPHQLSGGQLQRISIALAIANSPSLIILDEPTTSLDAESSAELLDLLIDLKEQIHNSYIFISHDLHAVKDLCDFVAVMYLGRIVEIGSKQQIFENPRHPYTQALMGAMLSITKSRDEIVELTGEVPSPVNLPKGCYFASRCPYAADKCRESYPDRQVLGEGSYVCCYQYQESEE